MQVANDEWTRAGAATPANLMLQNVGTCRIAFVLQASQPAADAIELDSDEHFILAPGTIPVTLEGLDTDNVSCWVRALGPIAGELAVS